jgi:catechol 2,3-dioxygenase-like lactoylglutathione lyase family enzyme
MLKVLEFASCCYVVTDMARARAFYEAVLGLGRMSHTR